MRKEHFIKQISKPTAVNDTPPQVFQSRIFSLGALILKTLMQN